tara:strand:- start:58 stop:252 length:195 start_codon:yes stop_codon:yes gene_type:complete
MMRKAKIGDKALFKFVDGRTVFGVIGHIPVATNDSWIISEIFEDKEFQTLYIQQFETMSLREKE